MGTRNPYLYGRFGKREKSFEAKEATIGFFFLPKEKFRKIVVRTNENR
jgi:hypothetical protein